MNSLVQIIQTYWQVHGVVGVLAAWTVVSGILNLAFRLKTPEQWVTWADSNPKTKVLVDIVRGTGTDPVAVLDAFQVYSQKKADAVEAAAKKDGPKS